MTTAFLSLLLAALLFIQPAMPAPAQAVPYQQNRLWWGMIDPELAVWFSRLPFEESTPAPILWDFSWRGFLAALFDCPRLMEEVPHATQA